MQIRPVLVVAVCLARSQQRHQVQQMLIGHLRMDKLGQLGHRHRNSSFVLVVVFAWNCWKRSVVAADVVVVEVFVVATVGVALVLVLVLDESHRGAAFVAYSRQCRSCAVKNILWFVKTRKCHYHCLFLHRRHGHCLFDFDDVAKKKKKKLSQDPSACLW